MHFPPGFWTRFRTCALSAGVGIWLSGCAQAPAAPPTTSATAQRAPEQLKPEQRCPFPVWPADLAKSLPYGYRSKTGLRFLIGPDGQVRDAAVAKSSGFKSLDQSALSALRLCHFKPTLKDGKPVEEWQPVEYVWTIE